MESRTSTHTFMKAFGAAALAGLLGLGIVLLLAALVGPAKAHSWYPWFCCSNRDCAPVVSAQVVPEGMVVTTQHGTVFIPASFPYRESKDGQMHACIRQKDGETKLICAFRPPLM